MIIPIKCFTCGTVLANKYRYYLRTVRAHKLKEGMNADATVYLTEPGIKKTVEGSVLDDLKLFNVCCRRHMLTHVDIE